MHSTLESDTAGPPWFRAAIGARADESDVLVRGARIRYRTWNGGGRRDIVLVHGGAAHSGWWDHIAPLLAEDNRVVALDLSGHGDSDHREHYGIATWGAEVVAVAEAAGFAPGYTVIGHSLGGLITLHTTELPDSPVSEAILVDSPVGPPGARTPLESRGLVASRRRHYASAEQAIARFRPVPDQSMLPYVADHIAAHSVILTPEGWTWKFDSGILSGGNLTKAVFAPSDARLAFFQAELGLVDEAARAAVESAGAIFVTLAEAGHAPMLDQPVALVTGLRTVLAAWTADSTRESVERATR